MPDPISLVAFGAAIGGAAGKFAERAWDSADRWLAERFGSHAAEAQARARLNAGAFVSELAAKISNLETEQRIERQRIDSVFVLPQFSALLQRTLLNAAETEEPSKHDLLASLVAERLLADADTTLALASGLASDAIARSTHRQLKLMAICSFVDEIKPRVIRTLEEYRVWLQACLAPFADFDFREIDARHLVAISCASYDPTSGRGLQVWLSMKLEPELSSSFLDLDIEGLPEVEVLLSNWDSGLAGIALTSVGSIVGALSFDQLIGFRMDLPKWD